MHKFSEFLKTKLKEAYITKSGITGSAISQKSVAEGCARLLAHLARFSNLQFDALSLQMDLFKCSISREASKQYS